MHVVDQTKLFYATPEGVDMLTKELAAAHAWAAAGVQALVGSHDLFEALAGWLERIGGIF